MSVFNHRQKYENKSRWPRRIILSLIVLVIVSFSGAVVWYRSGIVAPDPDDNIVQVISIDSGLNDADISALLLKSGLIKSSTAYQFYLRLNNAQGKTQAGSYELSPAMSVEEVVDKFVNGTIAVDLITILPAQRIGQLREFFISEGYFESEVDEALNPDKYEDHPALADKPPLASLEGYLYPESFQYTDNTPLKVIIEASLDQMNLLLTPKIKQGLADRGLTPHQGIILASIVEKEVSNIDDKPTVAQVFLTRLEQNIALGSDVTGYYGASLSGLEETVVADTFYNTRIYPGLPPGPISNISASSLQAVVNPASSDYLFFVAGDDGITYFSRTVAEHEALAAQHCIILCQIP